ncbi:hypothetical protein JCM5296_005773 [Sporobolomyces johnsonii]
MKDIRAPSEPLLDVRCFLGESPIYQKETNELHFIDIERGEVHHLDLTTKEHTIDYYEDHVSCIRLRQDEPGFIACADRGFALLPPRSPSSSPSAPTSLSYHTLLPPSHHHHTKMFNDGEVDPLGRFMAGTKPGRGQPMEGKLDEVMWRIGAEKGKVEKVMDGLGLPNGIGFSADEKKMYYTDTVKQSIATYAFDPSTGAISNEQPFVSTKSADSVAGHPDGLCVDAADNVYSARFGGGKIVRFTPEGKADLEIVFDEAWNITACELGGENGSTLFVTTASLAESGDDGKEELVDKYVKSGAVWAIDLSGEGVEAKERYRFRG